MSFHFSYWYSTLLLDFGWVYSIQIWHFPVWRKPLYCHFPTILYGELHRTTCHNHCMSRNKEGERKWICSSYQPQQTQPRNLFQIFVAFNMTLVPARFVSPRHRWTEAMCEAHVTSPAPSSLDVTSLNGSRKPRPPESFASIASKLERHVFYVPIWRQAVSQRDAFQRRELWWCSVEIDHSLASPEDYCAPAPPGRVKHNRISSNNHHLFSRLRHCIAQH